MVAIVPGGGTALQMDAIFGGFLVVFLVFFVVFGLIPLAGMWKMFQKAGKPGWAAIIPIYNIYVALQIIGRPDWWLILFIIPFVNFFAGIILALDLAKAFGKSSLYGIGIIFLPFITLPILGFGDARYQGVVN